MSLRVMVLTDRKRIMVSDAEEKQIVPGLSRPQPERVIVQGMPYKKTMIAYFDDPTLDELRGWQSQLEVDPNAKRLNESLKGKCVGKYSIAAEIMARASVLSGIEHELNPDAAHWSKLLPDKDWRDMMRGALLVERKQWCDAKDGTCFCEEDLPELKPFHVKGGQSPKSPAELVLS